jgi:hypothetical protein
VSTAVLDDRVWELGGLSIFLPGVRLTLWLAGAIMALAGVLSILSLRPVHAAEAEDRHSTATDGTAESPC